MLLVGDVGVGKTIFIRHLIHIDAADVLKDALVLYIDLGSRPTFTPSIGPHVATEISEQLRNAYGIDIEERNFVRGVYHSDLARFRRGIFADLAESSPDAFALKEIDYLASLIEDPDTHIRRSLDHLVKGRGNHVAVFLDNVDQRSYEFQQSAFLVANGMAERWPATVFLTLRPETFFRSKIGGALSAYHPKAFTISPPRLDVVIEKRISYATALAKGGRFASLEGVKLHVPSLEDYLDILQQSFTGDHRELIEFCDNMCGGNIRLALEFIRIFIGSGHVNTQKILAEYQKRGRYQIPPHEFLRAVIFGDYEHFDPKRSEITNLFDITSPERREHFLLSILVAHVIRAAKTESDGYLQVADVFAFLQSAGFGPAQVAWALQRSTAAHLLEYPARSTSADSDDAQGAGLAMRATSIGAYYVTRMSHDFTYVEAMIVDTPIVGAETRSAIYGMPTGSIPDRIARVEAFRAYLDSSWDLFEGRDVEFSWSDASDALVENMKQVQLGAQRALARRN